MRKLDRNEYCNEFSDNLYRMMKFKKIGVAELSRRSGVSQASIYRYIDPIKSHIPDAYSLRQLAYGLNVGIEDLADV